MMAVLLALALALSLFACGKEPEQTIVILKSLMTASSLPSNQSRITETLQAAM